MRQAIDNSYFHRAFESYGRSGQFSRAARNALFTYLEDYEDSTGDDLELGVIALCCEWAEYDSACEAAAEFGWEPDEDGDEDAALAWLQGETVAIDLGTGGVLVQSF